MARYEPGVEPMPTEGERPLVQALAKLEADIGRDHPDFLAMAFALFDLRGLDLDTNSDEALEMATVMVKVKKLKDERRLTRDALDPESCVSRARATIGTVYYMRMRDLIKIGFTAGPVEKRRRDLLADAVLATEPGGRDLESRRHKQFSIYRHEGERFHPGKDLLLHIAHLNEQR